MSAEKQKTLAVIGLGLVGGSIVKHLLSNSDYQIVGFDSDQLTCQQAAKFGVKTIPLEKIEADLTVISVSPKNNLEVVQEMLADSNISSGMIIDTCSFMLNLKHSRFIASHPLAGKAESIDC